jgi:hypothetical protein
VFTLSTPAGEQSPGDGPLSQAGLAPAIPDAASPNAATSSRDSAILGGGAESWGSDSYFADPDSLRDLLAGLSALPGPLPFPGT